MKVKKLLLTTAMMLSLGLAGFGSAHAATATGTLDVSATVGAVCSVTTTPVAFGAYSGSEINTTGGVSVTCTNLTPYNITLDAGAHYDAVSGYRTIAQGLESMPYVLFTPAGDPNEWGDAGYAGTYAFGSPVADTGNGAAQPHVVNARLLAGASVSSGTYNDVVGVTVHY
jgi:spore coat protein U-like protein